MQEVEDFINSLPLDEKRILIRLRSLILETDPRVQEKLSFGVPYFFHNRRICFLWPASYQPCSEFRPSQIGKVELGLCYGNLLSNQQGLLLQENRKQVFLIRFNSLGEINDQAIREIIQEAVLVDDEFRKNKSKGSETKNKHRQKSH